MYLRIGWREGGRIKVVLVCVGVGVDGWDLGGEGRGVLRDKIRRKRGIWN